MIRSTLVSVALLWLGSAQWGTAFAADKSGARANVVSLPRGPGSIEGLGESFEVNLNSGSVSETIRLAVPPGTGGFGPSLALTYNSGVGNGPLGIGWSLGTSTLQVKTDRGLPHYDSTDRFMLDGGELVEVSAGTYRLKNESRFVRVQRTGGHWEVHTPEGLIHRYGLSSSARVEDGSRVYSWALEESEDVFGNRIVQKYVKDGGEVYLSEVLWNARAGAADNKVTFEYEDRPDPLENFRPTFIVRVARRLRLISVHARGVLVRRYRLDYSNATGLSLLTAVTQIGSDDKTALPPVTFGYSAVGAPAAPRPMQSSPAAVPSPAGGNVELIDIDGDSFVDLLEANAGAHAYYLNEGGLRFSQRIEMPSSPSVALSTDGVETGDLNGDGLVDLIAKVGGSPSDFRFFPNGGAGAWESSVVFTNNPSFGFEDPNVRMLDFDNDKLIDVVQSTPTGFALYRNRGDGSWDDAFSAPLPPGDTAVDFADARMKLSDMNGDGLLDLVFVRSGSVMYWPHKGFGDFDAPRTVSGAPEIGVASENELQLADVTGDGLADLLFVGLDHVDYWPLLPTRAFGPKVSLQTPHRDPSRTTVRLADLNGNGTPDLIWSTPTAAPEQRLIYVDLIGDVRANLLNTVHNGLGKVTSFVYTDSGLESLRARESGAPWSTRVPFAIQVLAKSSTTDGLGHTYVTGYSYRDGYYAADTREFRGFASAEKRMLGDEASPTAIEAFTFDVGRVDEALKGRQTLAETRTESGLVLKKETMEWDVALYATGLELTEVKGARLRKKTTFQVEGSDTPTSFSETFDYDGFGNLVLHHEEGAVGTPSARGGMDGRKVQTTYAINEAAWLLRSPATVVTTDEAGNRLGEVHFHYDGNPFEGLPLGQVSRGALSRKSAWVEGSRFIDLERLRRDEFGNVVATLQPNGLERVITFDSHNTFPVEERVSGAFGSWAWTAKHDPGTGSVLEAKDPNGALSLARYDALGRVTAIAKPGDTLEKPTEWFEYKLASPISELWTHEPVDGVPDGEATTVSFHDGFGRKLRTAQKVGAEWSISGVTEYTALAQKIRQYHAFLAPSPDAPTPAGTSYESYSYDAAGRIVLHKRADGTLLKNVMRPLEHDEYDAEDNRPDGTPLPRTIRINRRNKPYEVIDRIRDANGTVREVLSALDYDGEGRVRRVTDADGHTRTLSYDGLGRLMEVDDPDAGKRRYTYDDEGNLLTLTTELGQVVSTYDVFNRLLTESGIDPSGQKQSGSVFHYDEAPPGGFGEGGYATRLSWVEDDGGQEHYRYDLRGNVTGRRRILDGKSYDVLFTFSAAERLTGVTYPSGQRLEITTDELNRTTSISGLLSDVRYDAKGSILGMELGNGVTETRSYDALDRLTQLTIRSMSTTLRDATLVYDGRSNLTAITDPSAPSLSARYVYDDLSRVVGADIGGQKFTYAYADDGNLTALNGEATTYDASRPHAIASIGAATFTHGAIGALTGWGDKKATFNALGHLKKIETPKGAVTFTYGFDGRLLMQEGPDGRRLFPSTYQEIDESGTWNIAHLGKSRLARFRFAGEPSGVGCGSTGSAAPVALAPLLLLGIGAVALIGERRRRSLLAASLLLVWSGCNCGGGMDPRFDQVFFIHSDAVGSANFSTDRDGKPSQVAPYAPFGKALADNGEKHLFNGRYTASSVGLSFWPQRALALDTGRWNMPDVSVLEKPAEHILSPQGLNPYVYAANNPVNFQDEKGAYEEPIHGALTYHLAIKAGFTESEATQIALSCAGVDHNKKTAPTPSLFGMFANLRSGVTEHYHFADPPEALARTNSEIAKGAKMNLNKLGVTLHTLEDVGFVDALGPHMRGEASTNSPILSLVNNGHRGGHPTHRTQTGELSEFHNKYADQPHHDQAANHKTLDKVYSVLVRAAQARHPGVKSDDAGARALIREVVAIDTASGINAFLHSQPSGANASSARSYVNLVMVNYATGGSDADGVRWRHTAIDSSVGED